MTENRLGIAGVCLSVASECPVTESEWLCGVGDLFIFHFNARLLRIAFLKTISMKGK